MKDKSNNNNIRTFSQAKCCLCGAKGNSLYRGLKDRIFNAPGEWNFRKCQKPECGLVWLDPMPHAEDISKLYRKYYTHTIENSPPNILMQLYERIREGILASSFGYRNAPKTSLWRVLGQILGHIPFLRERIGGTVMWLEASQCGRLLDVGCGNGKLLRRMHDLGWDVVGVEPDREAAHLVRTESHLEVYNGLLEQATFPDSTFDAIIMHHTLEHLPDPLRTLKESLRILRKDGLMILVTPNALSLGSKRYGPDWRGLEPPRHLYLFTSKNIQRALSNAGFSLASVKTLARLAPQIWISSDSILNKRLCEKSRKNHKGFLRQRITKATHMLKYPVYQTWESISLYANSQNGEEILAIAKKP